MTTILATIYAFLFGACVGSFLNVCVARWPLELSVVRPRSRCPRCTRQLPWYENVPLVSWLALRARCRGCRQPISAQYPVVELLVALGWAASAYHFGATFTAFRVAIVGTTLLGVALTDFQHYLIPDGFTLFGLTFVLVTSIASFFLGETTFFATPYEALIGACAGAGLIAIVGWLGEVALRREAMGLGDVTLMAFVGGAVGPSRAIMTIFVASALGAVAFLGVVYPLAWLRRSQGREQTELALGRAPFEAPLVPFGVFLAPAAMLTLLWGDVLLAWLLRSS